MNETLQLLDTTRTYLSQSIDMIEILTLTCSQDINGPLEIMKRDLERLCDQIDNHLSHETSSPL